MDGLPPEMQSDPAWRSYIRQYGRGAALARFNATQRGEDSLTLAQQMALHRRYPGEGD
jgi:hypothetical protein